MSSDPNPNEKAPKPFTVDEQSAFCRLTDGVANAVLIGTLLPRRANQLKWALDQLAVHHNLTKFGVSPADGLIPVIICRPTLSTATYLEIDFTSIRNRAYTQVAGVPYYDLELHLPDQRILAAQLENVPNGVTRFSVEDPPGWIHFK